MAYIQAKVSTLVPSQIRALRLKSEVPRQPDLARAAEMHQSRISMLETAGANPTISTLSAIAAALKVGLKIEFVPFSEMLTWENGFSQDTFHVTPLEHDAQFIHPQQRYVASQAMAVAFPKYGVVTNELPFGMLWPHRGSIGIADLSAGFADMNINTYEDPYWRAVSVVSTPPTSEGRGGSKAMPIPRFEGPPSAAGESTEMRLN